MEPNLIELGVVGLLIYSAIVIIKTVARAFVDVQNTITAREAANHKFQNDRDEAERRAMERQATVLKALTEQIEGVAVLISGLTQLVSANSESHKTHTVELTNLRTALTHQFAALKDSTTDKLVDLRESQKTGLERIREDIKTLFVRVDKISKDVEKCLEESVNNGQTMRQELSKLLDMLEAKIETLNKAIGEEHKHENPT